MLSESQIEKKLRGRVKEIGGIALKFISPGYRGVPDRIVFLPEGRIYLVELKKPGEKLRPLQLKVKSKFEKLGFKYYVVDSYKKVEDFINEVQSEV
jgi:hypothetical protein